MRYANISDAKKNGVVYTPRKMANYLANEIYKHWKGKKTDSIDMKSFHNSLMTLLSKIMENAK